MFKKGTKLANMTHSVIARRSCGKIITEKTYWKRVVLPNALYGVNILDLSKNRIRKVTENIKWSNIDQDQGQQDMKIPALRDVGAMTTINRITERQWKYLSCFERWECTIERDGKGNNGTRHN